MERLRVSSLQPQEVGPDFLDLWADSRLCPHFHLPLQSGSDPVLRRMRRRYTARQYEDALALIRERVAGASVAADVIVGFPGETKEDFENTYALCQRAGFAGMHVFPYSVRPGTSAAHFQDQVPQEEKSRRVQALLQVAEASAREFRGRILGDVRPVLWEDYEGVDGTRLWSGLTDNYVRVLASDPGDLANQVTPARLLKLSGDAVLAEVVR